MENDQSASLLQRADKQTNLADVLRTIEKTCNDCQQLAPITCISRCNTWRLKNQLRKLQEKTRTPDFMIELLNTLKNRRRLQLLEIVSKKHCSITQLQKELRKLGFNHSQRTIVEEYLNSLMTVRLADEHQHLYFATLFGQRISDLTKDFHDLEHILSPHSKCYEEMTLMALMKESRTYEKLGEIIPENCVPRVLSRLKKAALVETRTEKDFVFFFKTKRDANASQLSPTEKRIHDGIPLEGISARKLAKETSTSLRRTYKYLRKLRGKKLVFTRRRPIAYSITAKGVKIGTMLEQIRNLTAEISAATANTPDDEQAVDRHAAEGAEASSKKIRNAQTITLPATELVRPNSYSLKVRVIPQQKMKPNKQLV
jgi:predicted transcriptional regulator